MRISALPAYFGSLKRFLVTLMLASICVADVSLAAADAQVNSRIEAVIAATKNFEKPEKFEAMQAGSATSLKLVNEHAFSHNLPNIGFEGELDFKLGNALFRKLWVSSPSSTKASDGLGPYFNARSCQGCHLKDGRGHPPASGEKSVSLFLRLAKAASTDEEFAALANKTALVFPDPVYGAQLQNFAVPGLIAEGDMTISYSDKSVTLSDGNIVVLQKPQYQAVALAFGPLDNNTTLSPRIAPPMIGLGLVEQIGEADILANADPDDLNGDGISGRPQLVRDSKTGNIVVGRFGWKAANATIRGQSAGAFAGDIGISSPDVPNHRGDCTKYQLECLSFPTGVQQRLGDTEAPEPVLDLVTFYSQNLAVPKRRNVGDKQVLRGKQLFYQAGCIACHMPKFVTRSDAPQKAHSFQLIWPYSDFLLHDMGSDLADGQRVGEATGREWRTPPLWGIGLTKTVSGHTRFLHDGRARNFAEAILWHGGEAQAARDAFANMNKKDRTDLIAFLGSL